MKTLLWIGLIGLVPFIGSGQNPQPSFATAEIRPSAHLWNATMQGGLLWDGRYELHQATLLDLVTTAYAIDADRVAGGPAWLDWDRFDVAASLPESAPRESIRPMLQGMLAARFKLSVHEGTKLMPA